jgi:hypothetical protein
MSNGMTSIFLFNIIGFLGSLTIIIVLHYIVGVIIKQFNKKLNPIYIEKHSKLIDILIKLK